MDCIDPKYKNNTSDTIHFNGFDEEDKIDTHKSVQQYKHQ